MQAYIPLEKGDSPRGGEMPAGQRGPLSTRGTGEAGGGVLWNLLLLFQVSQKNPSVSLRLPAQHKARPSGAFSREPRYK